MPSKSGVFKNNTKMFPFQAAILIHNWKKQNGTVVKDKDQDDIVVYGQKKKGDKEAVWKYDSIDLELMHDLSSSELFKLLKEPKGEKVKPLKEAATATVANTPGAGPINFPGDPGSQTDFAEQEAGSGDLPSDKKKKKLNVYIDLPALTFQNFESFKEKE